MHLKGKEPKTAASHDTPVTVAAETGVIGLGLATGAILALLWRGFRRVDRSFAGMTSLAAVVALTAPRPKAGVEPPAAVEAKEAVPV